MNDDEADSWRLTETRRSISSQALGRPSLVASRSRIEDALERVRARQAQLYYQAPFGHITLDASGRVRDANLAATRLLAKPLSEILGHGLETLLVPDDIGAVDTLSPPIASFNDSPEWILPARCRARARPHAGIIEVESFPAETGIEVRWQLLLRRASGRSISESSELWTPRTGISHQALLDALPVQVAVLDSRGIIRAVNAAWRRFAEKRGGSARLSAGVGLDYLEVCRHAARDDDPNAGRLASGIEAVIQGRQASFSLEYPCRTSRGCRWLIMTAAPLQDAAGIVMAHLDVTDRRRAEETARRAREAQARAGRSSALGILASSLLHELTQPLGAVALLNGSALDLLERDQPSTDDLKDVLRDIDTEIGRAAEILGRLRDFLRTRALIKERVRLDELVAQVVELMRWRADDSRIRLRISATPKAMPEIVIDRLQIEQVLLNLIENAIQAIERAHAERREIGIGIDLRDDTAELWVSDTGPGLPFSEQEPLFDLFHSLRDAGLGVGLAISRSIVEAHDGRLWVDSSWQEGTLIRFTLPLESQNDLGRSCEAIRRSGGYESGG